MYLMRIAVNGSALVVAGLVVPGLRLRLGQDTVQAAITVVLLAVIFGLINTAIKPVVKLLALPLNLVTLGLFSFVVNAGMLLLLAWVVDLVWKRVLVVGGFPPDLTAEALVAALLGSLVISAVSTTLALVLPDG